MGGTSCDSSPRKLNSFYAAERGETEELRSPDSWIYLSLLFPHSPPPYGKLPWIMLLSVSTWSLSSCSIITFLMTWPDIKHLTPHTSHLRPETGGNNTNIVTTSRNYNNTDTVSSPAQEAWRLMLSTQLNSWKYLKVMFSQPARAEFKQLRVTVVDWSQCDHW